MGPLIGPQGTEEVAPNGVLWNLARIDSFGYFYPVTFIFLIL